jgi:hypothetical protein
MIDSLDRYLRRDKREKNCWLAYNEAAEASTNKEST